SLVFLLPRRRIETGSERPISLRLQLPILFGNLQQRRFVNCDLPAMCLMFIDCINSSTRSCLSWFRKKKNQNPANRTQSTDNQQQKNLYSRDFPMLLQLVFSTHIPAKSNHLCFS
ncbi:hypothetical protein DQ04_20321000, partial [Trypanosoma grayi]|uniref:hypothetical protein n=1 Tax=Trypanosoma grayi TaxID=71804 RepID=UPI0004F465FD